MIGVLACCLVIELTTKIVMRKPFSPNRKGTSLRGIRLRVSWKARRDSVRYLNRMSLPSDRWASDTRHPLCHPGEISRWVHGIARLTPWSHKNSYKYLSFSRENPWLSTTGQISYAWIAQTISSNWTQLPTLTLQTIQACSSGSRKVSPLSAASRPIKKLIIPISPLHATQQNDCTIVYSPPTSITCWQPNPARDSFLTVSPQLGSVL